MPLYAVLELLADREIPPLEGEGISQLRNTTPAIIAADRILVYTCECGLSSRTLATSFSTEIARWRKVVKNTGLKLGQD
jgi:hypothetical protein